MNTISYKGDLYPLLQTEGNMTQYARPFAVKFCSGVGYDIGYCKDEWKLYPDSIGVDTNTLITADNLPFNKVDYIYSSHCLEHLGDWVYHIEHWVSRLKSGGVLFLYLPHPSQRYWKPWHNRKHLHSLHPEDVEDCMRSFGLGTIFCGDRDLSHSYMIVGEKS